jgi:hypothetical protein
MRLSAEQRRRLEHVERELSETDRLVALVTLLNTRGPRWWRRARSWQVLVSHPESPSAFALCMASAVLAVLAFGALGAAATLAL